MHYPGIDFGIEYFMKVNIDVLLSKQDTCYLKKQALYIKIL